nr:hypothetical protein [Bacillus cereus group sp. BfR-BA-01380]
MMVAEYLHNRKRYIKGRRALESNSYQQAAGERALREIG